MTLLRKMSISAMVLMLIFAFTVPAFSQVNVTFRVNTSTNNDTLNAGHFVQMRGQHTGTFADGKNITWGDDSDLIMTNVGGDYWELTVQMNPQDTLYYKFWAGFTSTSGTGGSGWENGFVKGPLGWDTRTYISGTSDEVLDMQYFHDDAGEVDQLWRPFEVKADTVAVWFRVNMAGLTKKQQFDPAANGPLAVRGDGGTSGGALDWGANNVELSREGSGDFWSGAAYMPKASLTAGTVQQYKFFVANKHADGPDWESIDNRTFAFSNDLINTTMDTTLAWRYFNNEAPALEDPVPGNVIFRVAVDALEKTGLFSRTVGDSIIIKGPKGWDDADAIRMDYNPVLNEYTANVPFNMVIGSTVYYKYFVKWHPSRVDAASPNYLGYQFQSEADLGTGWEEPAVNGGADRTFQFAGTASQLLPGDFGFQNQYFNSLLPTGVTTNPVTVTFNVNMMTATDASTNPDLAPFRVGSDTAWIKIDTPLFRQTQQVNVDSALMYMLTDSDGDGIYSATTTLLAPTFISVPYSIVYTSEDGRIDNASGYSLGRRYYQFIHPVSVSEALIPTYPASFNFPTVDWKKPGECTVETAPDLQTPKTGEVNVTFRVNTSTNNDTLNAGHFVQMRGQHTGTFADGKNITWGDDSDLIMTNVGGDYWELTVQMNPQDTLYYKFWAGFTSTSGTGGSGWENGFVKGPLGWDTRTYISGTSDEVIDMQYFHDDAGEVNQFWRPFEVKADTVAVWFRVNMAGLTKKQQFDPAANGPLAVRGDGGTSGGALDWGANNVELSREGSGDFWSGAAYMPKASLTAGTVQQYKFFVANKHADGPDWESIDNRTFAFSNDLINTTMDTTLAWRYFNNEAPALEDPVPGNVIFRVAVDALEKTGLFSRTVGDSIIIKGPKGWDDADAIRMDYNPVLNEYTANVPFNMVIGSTVYYKYFVKWHPSRVDAASPNYLGYQFQSEADLGTGWEEPAVNGGADRTFVFAGSASQSLPGDFGFAKQYFNSLLPTGVTTNPVTVTFNVNMMTATDASTNPDLAPFRVGSDTAWIKIDTPLFRQTQKVNVDSALMYMLTDSDGDGIYSATTTLLAPTFISVPYSIVYTSEDGRIDNASGYSLGRRYYQFVHPTAIDANLIPTYPSEFTFPTVDWKKPGECTVETAPDLLHPVAVKEQEDLLPTVFALEQNYPNPFNPETTVKYSLANSADVKINVYNSIGQLVRTLVNQKQEQGTYTITWKGTDFSGRIAPSGIYFVKMVAGNFQAVRKMTLLK